MLEVNRRVELARFLRTYRERLLPQDVGLPSGTRRRTPGLRREELAYLIGVSPTWYTYLEQGRSITVSPQVLESIVRALQLNTSERTHLFALARGEIPACRTALIYRLSPDVQQILDSSNPYPAYVINPCWDVLAWNEAACRVFVDFATLPIEERNIVHLMFLSPFYQSLLIEWECQARHLIALFRSSTCYHIGESWLTNMVTTLSERSQEFRQWWEHNQVVGADRYRTLLNHPVAGRLTLQATSLQVTDTQGLSIQVYFPHPDTDTAERLQKLVQAGPA